MQIDKETTGAWIIHHGRKLALDANGSAEFPAIDEAAKAATLLAKLAESSQATLNKSEVRGIAASSGINPRFELNGLLDVLAQKRLIDESGDQISILGLTSRATLSKATEIYNDANPSVYENASISLAEITSESPIRKIEIAEKIGDQHKLSTIQVNEFLNRAEEIGFVDREGESKDSLLFNGNLFRKESVFKTERVLASLNTMEQQLFQEINQELSKSGCLDFVHVEKKLSKSLFEKLIAAGVYDLNQVNNESGSHVYVTSPSAFHKFVDPMVDDCFDMAKSLVAALTYGMKSRSANQGRITALPALLNRLIAGDEIGPATAIGQDYRVLEFNRVVRLRQHPTLSNRFFMRLVKKDVGQLALQVLSQGNSFSQGLIDLPGAPMAAYFGPEHNRTTYRKRQSVMSRNMTHDILDAVRGGRVL